MNRNDWAFVEMKRYLKTMKETGGDSPWKTSRPTSMK
jgi:hypothetical protein